MKKELFILFGILLLLNVNLVSSHFVCGVVDDSADNLSASWFNVKIFYPGEENNYASCEVSPQDNKYCCDVEEILNHAFNPGETLSSKVIETEAGYAAGPVSVILTNESYDIMPTMKLEKVINIFEPDKKIIFSNETDVFLNASFLEGYNHVELERGGSKIVLCENCTNYSQNFSFGFGMNYFEIFASNNHDTFSRDFSFALLNEINFNREAVCKNCKNNHVKSSSVVNMKLNLNLSNEVEGFLLREYVPSSWGILDLGSGELISSNDDYNLIVWNVTGKNILVNYSVQAPKTGIIRPQRFLFKSELEDFNLGEDEIQVRRFFPFWAIFNSLDFDSEIEGKFFNIDSSHPLVFNSDDAMVKGGVFPTKSFNKIKFAMYESLSVSSPDKKLKMLKAYSVRTNLRESDVKNVFFELRLNKNLAGEKDIIFFERSSGNWEEISPLSTREDDEYFYYYFKSGFLKKIWIGYEDKSFLQSWLQRFFGNRM